MSGTTTRHRALLVEDNAADARLVRELLAEAPDGFTLTVADRLGTALDRLEREAFDVVLVDLGLPDATGSEVIDQVCSRAGSTPVVVYSGAPDGEAAERARARGASDILRKGALTGTALTAALQTVVGGAGFTAAVRERVRRAKGSGADVAVVRLIVDVPGGANDAVLVTVIDRLAGRLRNEDALFDLGDGRFGIVADVEGLAGGARLARDLEHALSRPLLTPRGEVTFDVRAGQAVAVGGNGTADAILDRAAAALRLSSIGTDPAPPSHLTLSPPPLGDHVAAGPSFTSRLRTAIRQGELVLHYQPIARIGDDQVPLVEALVRWDDPARGLVPPAEFIPLAEETSLIEEVGVWALTEACRQIAAWDAAGVPPVRCAVNLSARELCSAALPTRVAEALATAGVSPNRLEVELTESMFADADSTAHMISRLREIGVRVAIDDFGTGYSSLAYLTKFSVDTIKIDGLFVRRAAEDADAGAVVKAIVDIAHQLGLEVVAEGVETVEQLAFARNQGCDLVQGWLFCEALPADATADWLRWARQRVLVGSDAARTTTSKPATQANASPQADVDVSTAALRAGVEPARYVGGIAGARPRSRAAARRDKAVMAATLAAGSALGAILALPVAQPSAATCPAAGEGRAMCIVQKGYMPSILIFLACVLAAVVIVGLLQRWPERVQARRRQREHDLHRTAEASARRAERAAAERRMATGRAAPAPLLRAENYQAASGRPVSPATRATAA